MIMIQTILDTHPYIHTHSLTHSHTPWNCIMLLSTRACARAHTHHSLTHTHTHTHTHTPLEQHTYDGIVEDEFHILCALNPNP